MTLFADVIDWCKVFFHMKCLGNSPRTDDTVNRALFCLFRRLKKCEHKARCNIRRDGLFIKTLNFN